MENVDRIGSLPDELLHDILSHLNVKQVFESRVLSKRWRNLWSSVRKVNIEDKMFLQDDYQDRCCLEAFLDYFLRNRHPQTDSFRISCPSFFCKRDECFRISYASFFCQKDEFDLPRDLSEDLDRLYSLLSLFFDNYEAQEIFIQNMPKLIVHINCRHPFFTPTGHTKTLELTSVVLRQVDRSDKFELRYKCLENLTIRDCTHAGLRHLRIRAPCLKNLIVENNNIGGSDIESCVFELTDASNVRTIEFKGYMYQDYLLEESLHALLTAHLDMKVTNERLGMYVCNALRGVRNAKSLTISTYGFPVGGQWEWEAINFPMLKYVKLQYVQGGVNELKFLQLLVKHAMNLEKIHITVEAYDENRETELVEFKRKVQEFVCSSRDPKEFIMKQHIR